MRWPYPQTSKNNSMILKMIKKIESDSSNDENKEKSSISFIAKNLGDFFFVVDNLIVEIWTVDVSFRNTIKCQLGQAKDLGLTT